MSAWKLVVNFAIPPALILTVLLILPTPTMVKKALLLFTRKVLFLDVIGRCKLVHMMMFLTGCALVASSIQTYKLGQDAHDSTLTPNQRIGILARKWREERNFWIALLSFLLWSFLWRFYTLMLHFLELKTRCKALEGEVATLKALSGSGGTGTVSGVAAPAPTKPSAPPMVEEDEEVEGSGKRKVQ